MPTKEELDERAAKGRAKAQHLRDIKAKIYELEKTNYDKLYLFESRNNWHKFGGHSALIYASLLAPRLKVKAKIRADSDFYSKFHDGVVSIKDVKALEKHLKELKIYASYHGKSYTIYDLYDKVSPETIDQLRHQEEIRREQLNAIIMPKIVAPSVNAKIHEILQTVYTNHRKACPTDRDFIINDIVGQVKRLHDSYLTMSNGFISEKDGVSRMLVSVNHILNSLDIIDSRNIWDVKTNLRIASALQDIRRILLSELHNLQQGEKNKVPESSDA